jgi:crotonobetainyl-CoA:carnitine CoA-transferase CaiB-like acyl-CoA transferase
MTGGLLEGVRVVDLTTVVVGPICTRTLADQGAEVVKVEAPGGDILRYLVAGCRAPSMSGKFINFNRNKRSVVLYSNVLDIKQKATRYNSMDDLLDDPYLQDVGFWTLDEHLTEGRIRRTRAPLPSAAACGRRRCPPRASASTRGRCCRSSAMPRRRSPPCWTAAPPRR